MTPFLAFITAHWFAVLLLLAALVPGALALRSQRRGALSLGWLLTAAALALAGVGGLSLQPEWGAWVAAAAASTFFVMFLVLVLTGAWLRPLAYAVAAVLAVGLGGMAALAAGEGLVEASRALTSLEPAHPWWLLLLLLVPLVLWFSYRSLAGLGPVRRWVALSLRCLLIALLAFALSELRLKHRNDTVTVLFLVDRSLSVPQEPDESNPNIDKRWERVKRFINEAVEKRGSGHERDKAGLIAFGKRPRLELPPSDAPRFKFEEFASTVDGNYTDIAAALKLALASFPEGSGKRIVLLSDGNENMGNAEEQARLAKQNGVQIDVVPLGKGQRNENEVLVERVEAPPVAEQGARLPIRVLVRSHNPNPVKGDLTLRQVVEGVARPVGAARTVTLAPGLNTFKFEQPLGAAKAESYTYEAEFVPKGVVNPQTGELERLTGDRVQNNRAATHVIARGRRRVLLIEAVAGKHTHFVREMRARKLDITTVRVEDLPKDKDRLAVLLSNFDCVILADVPADSPDTDKPENAMSEDQQEAIRSNTHEQGCGLVVIGGPDSYGAGGWQNTAIEKALPVESEIKAIKVQGKGGLVLIMHASEMADGNFWQKKIAKLAIEKLSNVDEVGILHYDWGQMKWHFPLQEIGDDEHRAWLKKQVDKLVPGDMPDFDPGLKMAHKALTDNAELVVRHVIIISDGDPMQNDMNILGQMKRDKVTVSTVGVATHGAPQDQQMARIANTTGGRYHKVTNPKLLPAVYIKETRLVSQSFVYEKKFQPVTAPWAGGPTENLGKMEPLYGFVRTTKKESPLVGVALWTPEFNGQTFPLLAFWQYGLGRSVAFTSDARTNPPGKGFWDRDWAGSDKYVKFWEQVITWALRPSESKNFVMTVEQRDGKVKVFVDARDDNNKPLTDLELRGKVTTPSGKAEQENRGDLQFKQTNAGVYEAEFKADEMGSYFINVQSWGLMKKKDGTPVLDEKTHKPLMEAKDGVRAGITVPYSPEYSDLETNTALLEKLRALTDGETYDDEDEALREAARGGEVFRKAPAFSKNLQPVWHWLLFAAAVLLFFDVASRRIALEFGVVVTAAVATWDRLRGRNAAADREPEFIDRLKARKAQVGQAIGQGKKARRFDAGDAPAAAAPPPGADEARPREASPRPAPRPKQAADAGQEGGDYLSRLKKAKKRAMEERDKEKDEE